MASRKKKKRERGLNTYLPVKFWFYVLFSFYQINQTTLGLINVINPIKVKNKNYEKEIVEHYSDFSFRIELSLEIFEKALKVMFMWIS